MKKMILVALLAMLVSTVVSGEEKTKNLEWNFSAETSYPKEMRSIKPADLSKRIAVIQKLNKGDPLSKECAEAVKRYDELLAKYSDRPEVYGEIPTCNLGERAFKVIFEMLSSASEDAPAKEFVKFGNESQTLLLKYWEKADAYFAKALGDSAPPEVWDAYLNYNIQRLGASFANFMMTDVYELFAKKAGKQAMINNFMNRFQQYLYEMAGDKNLKAAKMLYEIDPKNQRYAGMFGSLLVGRGFTDIIADMLKAAQKDKSSKKFDAAGFIAKDAKKPGIAKALDEGISVLQPVCKSGKYEQACKDMELAEFLKNPVPPVN